MDGYKKILYTRQISAWLGLHTARIQASFAANGVFAKEIAIDSSNHAWGPHASMPCNRLAGEIHRMSIYPLCLELEKHPKNLLADLEQYQSLAQKWHAILSKYHHDLNIMFDEFKPDAVVFVQGYEPINALVRLLAIEKNIPFYALENTAIADRMLWDDHSGITVHRNLAPNFYWRFCDSIPDEESDRYCETLIRETRLKKLAEHAAPSTPFLLDIRGDIRTVVFLGQVYTDSSVLFNSASWEDPIQLVVHLARLSAELNFRLVLKLHPKEATGSTPITNKPYNNLTYRKLMDSPEFLSLQLGNPNIFIDAQNEYDTYHMIESADAIVTMNSQSGLEAAIRGVPAVVCGHAFYGNLGFTFDAPAPPLLKIQLQSAFDLGTEGKKGMMRRARKFTHIFFEKYCLPKTPEALADLVCRHLGTAAVPSAAAQRTATSGFSPAQVLKATCLINNYNYGKFVCEAVSSALAQVVPFDEIIIVDDGSTDDSIARLRAAFGDNPKVKIITKPNGGQLSAFNRGFAESSGDIIFFLDADDLYDPAMLENILRVYRRHPQVGMVFGPVKLFDQLTGIDCVRAESKNHHVQFLDMASPDALPNDHRKEILFGGGREETLRSQMWTGSPTSALSLRRATLERFMPLPSSCEPHWRTRADDCLIFGAALLDIPRCYQPLPLVGYRIHGNNAWFSRKAPTPEEQKDRNAAIIHLFTMVLRQINELKAEESAQDLIQNVIVDAITREYGECIPFGREFRRGWRAFRRAGLPQAVVQRERWRFLKNALGHLLGRRQQTAMSSASPLR